MLTKFSVLRKLDLHLFFIVPDLPLDSRLEILRMSHFVYEKNIIFSVELNFEIKVIFRATFEKQPTRAHSSSSMDKKWL